jgi:two-component system cell cycle response regulator CpdR
MLSGVVLFLRVEFERELKAQDRADGRVNRLQKAEQALLRVLYVEDNDYVRDMTLCLLDRPSRVVSACKSAEEALDIFHRDPFDVVVTDVSLPNMSGVELAKRVRGLAPRTWVILASGYQLPTTDGALGENVRVIAKPFEEEELDKIFSEIRAATRGASSN